MTHNPFKLKRPCVDCPFRKDRDFPLDLRRAEEIADHLKSDGTFMCHKTVDYAVEDDEEPRTENASQCAGALATVLKDGVANAPYRVAERLGMFDMDKLEIDSTHDSLDEWVDHMKGLSR